MLEIITLPVLADNYIYLIHDPVSQETAAVDPALAEPVLDILEEKGWELTYILNTHHHSDHVGGNSRLKQLTGCKIIAAQADWDRIPGIDQGVDEGDVVSIGQHKANVIATPGHTRAHIVYHFAEDKLLFCGDTLFVMGCGRLFEGTAEQLWQSLQKLKALPNATKVYCTHEYTQTNGRFALTVEPNNLQLQQRMIEVNRLRGNNQLTIPTTIAEELSTNPFFREDSLDLRNTIDMFNSQPVEVFAKLRHLKDSFT
ncbi:hydroxyacylglutathione hydrolase GloB [Methyloglobulus morosus KoM1]|uniref:Hydroxyacylglutathione hydrolase n=1 Tax=Methyloglobulus morosus KoM1 TaxID=1116472 RepID=V5C0F5_9GAMM|nr:hydroxyacylglutathione hydrolase [Methyloglobulus morosus]ESS71987.1 hydroxyacylglutathione hydrolase GloB [Methyloglobulus morosus KoM1]